MSGHQPTVVTIYDASGRLVKSFNLGSMRSALCPMALPAGVYFVNLLVSNGTSRYTETKTLIVTGP